MKSSRMLKVEIEGPEDNIMKIVNDADETKKTGEIPFRQFSLFIQLTI